MPCDQARLLQRGSQCKGCVDFLYSERSWIGMITAPAGPRMLSYAPGGLCSSITTTRGATVRPNKIKQMWLAGQYVTMGWLSISHGFTAEVMARQGFDSLCIDMQHGTTEMNDVWPMLQAEYRKCKRHFRAGTSGAQPPPR